MIPVKSTVGKVNVAPKQILPIAANVGVTFGRTVMVIVVGNAHCPAAGVNV